MKGLEGSVFREGKHHRWSETGSGRRAEMGLGVVQKQLEGRGRGLGVLTSWARYVSHEEDFGKTPKQEVSG